MCHAASISHRQDWCRAEKKEIKKQVAADKALLARASLDIALVPERIDDIRHAAVVKFGSKTRATAACISLSDPRQRPTTCTCARRR